MAEEELTIVSVGNKVKISSSENNTIRVFNSSSVPNYNEGSDTITIHDGVEGVVGGIKFSMPIKSILGRPSDDPEAVVDWLLNSFFLTKNLHSGFIDYNDNTGVISLNAGEWTDVVNTGLGPNTNKNFRPKGVDELMDNSTGYLNFDDLSLGDDFFVRIDADFYPSTNNALLDCRYVLGQSEYPLNVFSKRLDNGAGIKYPSDKGAFYIYMGDSDTKSAAGKLQVRMSSGGTMVNNGVAIAIRKNS